MEGVVGVGCAVVAGIDKIQASVCRPIIGWRDTEDTISWEGTFPTNLV